MDRRIVLITGANSGVGYAIAKVLSKSSDYHIILSSRSLAKVDAAAAQLRTLNPQASMSTVALDVTSVASIGAAAASVEQTFGRLDVLVNNAGIGGWHEDLEERLMQVLRVNAIGSALVADAFRPLLMRATNPYSVYVSSGGGSFTRALAHVRDPNAKGAGQFKNDMAYRVSKAAQNMVAVAEWKDWGPRGLKVFVMSPGCVVSNIRGDSEEQRTAWGMARDADTAGETVRGIVEGERDAGVGGFVVEGGLYPW